MQMRSAIICCTLLVTLAGPVWAQSGGGVMATTPTSGTNSMATSPGLPPPGISTSGTGTTNSSQPGTPPSAYSGDVVSKVPGEPPPVSGGISHQANTDGHKKHKPAATGANAPPQ